MRWPFGVHRLRALIEAPPPFVLALGLALGVSCVVPSSALAVSPVDGARVVLGFGQPYGGGSVHRGVDLAAEAGSEVRAPASGTVSFVGTVPADGGGTVVAVTVEVADGTKVTVMPLSRAAVKRGATVEAGGSVGTLAGGGDGSVAESHLHLSLRRGSMYLDPTPLLSGTSGGTAEDPHTQGEGATSGAGTGVTAGGSAGADAAGSGAGSVTSGGVKGASGAASTVLAPNRGLASGVALAPKPGSSPLLSQPRAPAETPALAMQPGVVAAGADAPAMALGAPGAQAAPIRVVDGVDVAALLDRAQSSAAAYARRHVRALAIGVGALLFGLAALTPLGRRAGSGEAVCAVRPEGDAVAAAAGR